MFRVFQQAYIGCEWYWQYMSSNELGFCSKGFWSHAHIWTSHVLLLYTWYNTTSTLIYTINLINYKLLLRMTVISLLVIFSAKPHTSTESNGTEECKQNRPLSTVLLFYYCGVCAILLAYVHMSANECIYLYCTTYIICYACALC